MVQFELSADIIKPPDVIVQALLRAENAPYWNTDLVKFEVVSGEPGKVGSVGRIHYVQNGREHTMEDVMEYADPGKRYVSKVSGPDIIAHVETVIEPIDGGSMVKISWKGKGRRILPRLLLPLIRGRMVRQSQQELDKFKELVETRGADFSVSGD